MMRATDEHDVMAAMLLYLDVRGARIAQRRGGGHARQRGLH